jgi:hypothetical protein
MLMTDILDIKIMDHKGENHRAGDVSKETRGVGCWEVPMSSKVGDECIVGEADHLGQDIHATMDFVQM